MNVMDFLAYKLKLLKKQVVSWVKKKPVEEKNSLQLIESEIMELFLENLTGVFFVEDKVKIMELARKMDALLKHEEATMCIKSRAIWIEEGDNNTQFFHRYAS